MRVLVTGGAGFIGSHVAEALLRRGDEVSIVDNFNDFYDPQIKRKNIKEIEETGAVRVIEGDLLDAQVRRDALASSCRQRLHPTQRAERDD